MNARHLKRSVLTFDIKSSWLVFTDGRFQTHPEPPCAMPRDWLADQGYFSSMAAGDAHGLGFKLYEHDAGGKFVVRCDTPTGCCFIVCSSWPDLLELLSKVSTVALCGAMRQTKYGEGFIRTGSVWKEEGK
jgi:hypothetical protein